MLTDKNTYIAALLSLTASRRSRFVVRRRRGSLNGQRRFPSHYAGFVLAARERRPRLLSNSVRCSRQQLGKRYTACHAPSEECVLVLQPGCPSKIHNYNSERVSRDYDLVERSATALGEVIVFTTPGAVVVRFNADPTF